MEVVFFPIPRKQIHGFNIKFLSKVRVQVTTSLEHVEEKMYDFEANKVI